MAALGEGMPAVASGTPKESLALRSLQIGRSVLEPHDKQIRSRRGERTKRPAQLARYEDSDQISRTHSKPHREEMEATPQLDLFRMVSEVPRHTPECHSSHQREGHNRPGTEEKYLEWLRWPVGAGQQHTGRPDGERVTVGGRARPYDAPQPRTVAPQNRRSRWLHIRSSSVRWPASALTWPDTRRDALVSLSGFVCDGARIFKPLHRLRSYPTPRPRRGRRDPVRSGRRRPRRSPRPPH